KEKFIEDVLYGKLSAEEILNKAGYFGIDSSYDSYTAIAVQMDDYYLVTQDLDTIEIEQLENDFAASLKQVLEENKEAYLVENKAYDYVICIPSKVNESVKKKIDGVVDRLRNSFNSKETYSVTIAIGKTYRAIAELKDSYKSACEALDYKFIIGKGQNIYFDNLKSKVRNEFYSVDYNDLELDSLIKFADKKLIDQKLGDLQAYIRSKGSGSYLYMQIVVGSVYMQALRILKEVGGSAEEVFYNPIEVYNKIMTHQTVEGMIKELSKVLYKIADYVSAKQSGRFNNLIEKAKEYVKKNYYKDELSLDEIANYCNISSCYFSVIFKQEAGETFIDYLTRVRLEKAKEFLKVSELKAYEVSYKVGYNNPTYFSTLFKKYTGQSPTEYRNNSIKQ
ncbi:MAG: helix-turn-helix domain-containing protein, partial [Clostridia bacterium]|nr:helix-turn-helix domain-containing protein [Clostridia bacterium]